MKIYPYNNFSTLKNDVVGCIENWGSNEKQWWINIGLRGLFEIVWELINDEIFVWILEVCCVIVSHIWCKINMSLGVGSKSHGFNCLSCILNKFKSPFGGSRVCSVIIPVYISFHRFLLIKLCGDQCLIYLHNYLFVSIKSVVINSIHK